MPEIKVLPPTYLPMQGMYDPPSPPPKGKKQNKTHQVGERMFNKWCRNKQLSVWNKNKIRYLYLAPYRKIHILLMDSRVKKRQVPRVLHTSLRNSRTPHISVLDFKIIQKRNCTSSFLQSQCQIPSRFSKSSHMQPMEMNTSANRRNFIKSLNWKQKQRDVDNKWNVSQNGKTTHLRTPECRRGRESLCQPFRNIESATSVVVKIPSVQCYSPTQLKQ